MDIYIYVHMYKRIYVRTSVHLTVTGIAANVTSTECLHINIRTYISCSTYI